MHAIRIIQDEHRALAAVLHGLLHIVREIRYFEVRPNFELLRAMTYYIHAFPERLHHPKEEEYLFKLLRGRRPDVVPLLERLEQQHRTGAVYLQSLDEALDRYQRGGAEDFPAFASCVAAYAVFHREHASTEDNSVLPLARAHLTPDDWLVIDTAFAQNADPLIGTPAAEEFKELFRRIVSLAPPPLGKGPKLEAV